MPNPHNKQYNPYKRRSFHNDLDREPTSAYPRPYQSSPLHIANFEELHKTLQLPQRDPMVFAGSKLDEAPSSVRALFGPEPIATTPRTATIGAQNIMRVAPEPEPENIELVSSVSEMEGIIDLPETPFDILDTPYYRDLINRLRTSYKKIKTEYRNLDSRISRNYYDSDELHNFQDIVFELKNHRDNPHHRKNFRTILGIPEFDPTRYEHAVLPGRGPLDTRFNPLSLTRNPEIGIPFPRTTVDLVDEPEDGGLPEYVRHTREQIEAIPPARQQEIDELFAETGPEYREIINNPNRIEATLRWWILHAKMTFFF